MPNFAELLQQGGGSRLGMKTQHSLFKSWATPASAS